MKKREIKYVYSEHLIKQADQNPAVKGRASMTHELIRSYGLLSFVDILPPIICNPSDLRGFHNRDYVDQLKKCGTTDDEAEDYNDSAPYDTSPDSTLEEFGLGFDCPTWNGIIDYACAIAGSTMTACELLCKCRSNDQAPIILNWTGGWHHAHRYKAAGFCYVNDIVLGILVLRKRFQRVLYVDLDVHHGDGVEYAFDVTRHVFTLSFHKFECGFYPGSGGVKNCGRFAKGYAANFPYKNGISGDNFRKYFQRVLDIVVARYNPDVFIIQCGADSMAGDPLGGTQLQPSDIDYCVSYVIQRDMPTLILGGGGYNFANASRLWTQLTASLCGQTLCEDIPDDNAHFLNYGPDYSLHISKSNCIKDENTQDYLEHCVQVIEENLIKYNVSAVL